MRLDCGCCVLRPWAEGDEPSLVRHADNREVSRRLRDRFRLIADYPACLWA